MLVWNVDEVLRAWDDVERNTEELEELEEQLKSGVMKNHDGTFYTWKGLVNSNNEPFYTSKEEWEAECREEIEAIKDEIASDREILSECWSEYRGKKKDYQSGTFDEEMKKVLEWRQGYSKLLGNEV